ncbi:peroxisomal membrane 22 kDa (Mpv17/PMP22) family protein [Citrus sinensis]|uniref:Peroxisomal membrane 22 kDa (Mpv17/PMP22) family protein n=1 Tax=Citrus sinensis TaxID=2711 RepID=A0ACB8N467_CITSI|nr:peroxisomal membrane 22 kDa (Mpv17/PMP22) family protein [Citrus sinensis]
MSTLCKVSLLTTKSISNSPKFSCSPVIFSIKPITASHKVSTSKNLSLLTSKRRKWVIGSVTEDKEVFPADNKLLKDDKNGLLVNGSEDFEAVSSDDKEVVGDNDKLISRAINATIVLGAGTFAVTRLLTIDHDYWHGWTLYEILRYVPEHNWIAYEQALKANPVLAKMAISGIVYFIGDWIAQENRFLTLTCNACSDQALLGLLFMDRYLITITSFVRLFFLSKIGGWSLPKWPLIKLFGQQFGTASTSWFWDSCVLNPLPIFLVN